MANSALNTDFLDRAIAFAVRAHAGTERRGKGYPYVVHPLEALSIVASMTSDPELLAAAVLHDVVEDTDVTLEQLRAEFGDRVADIVAAESDCPLDGAPVERLPWRGRKEVALKRLEAAPMEALMVAMGDKLSNMRAIWRDYQTQGEALWSLFHAPGGRADHEWHYRSLARVLSPLAGTFAYREFVRLLRDVFGHPVPEYIDLENYERSGEGHTAQSYNLKSGGRMVKLYETYMPVSTAIRELETNRALQSLGLRIPEAFRLVTDGERVGVEFERIEPKKSYARAIADAPEQLPDYARRFADACKALHAKPCDTEIFESTAAVFREIVRRSNFFDEERKLRILAYIDKLPVATTCLHGDMHIGNIITDGKQDYWIDLSDFGYGAPIWDFGMFYLVTHCLGGEQTMEMFHFAKQDVLRVWALFVDRYFGGSRSLEEVDAACRPVAALYIAKFAGHDTLPEELLRWADAQLPQ